MKIVLEIEPILYGFDVDVQPDDEALNLPPEVQEILVRDITHAIDHYLGWFMNPEMNP